MANEIALGEECVLYERSCIQCGECDICDLDPEKRCDSCGKCIETTQEYAEIPIEKVILDEE